MGSKVHSFIVRVWNDSEEGGRQNADSRARGWRGSIDHVGTGQRLYFHELNSVLCFIREQVGDIADPLSLSTRFHGFWKRLRRTPAVKIEAEQEDHDG